MIRWDTDSMSETMTTKNGMFDQMLLYSTTFVSRLDDATITKISKRLAIRSTKYRNNFTIVKVVLLDNMRGQEKH